MLTRPNSDGLVEIAGITMEVLRRGKGLPILVIEGEEGLERESAFVSALAEEHEVIIAAPPGFGRSERPQWIETPNDLAFFLLDLVDALGLEDVLVVGASLGGWVAAEMASMDDSFIAGLVLIDPLGIKLGGPTDRDIADIWTLHPQEVAERKWADPEKGARDYPSMSEAELEIVARNSESFARFCWQPYMHNPKLKHRLHRISAPTLFIWGAQDGIVSPDYGRGYAELVAGARFVEIENAGHLPHIEQPQAVAEAILEFATVSSKS